MPFAFFFSSRRRYTRLQGDWSSDVCSSDLGDGDRLLAADDLHRLDPAAPGPVPVALGDLQLLHRADRPVVRDAGRADLAGPGLGDDHAVVGVLLGRKVRIVALRAVAAIGRGELGQRDVALVGDDVAGRRLDRLVAVAGLPVDP